MNVRNSFASLVDLHTYQITRCHLIKHPNFNTHREKLKFKFNFKWTPRRLNFRIKIQIVHHTDLALARCITRYQLTYVVYKRYCYEGYERYTYTVWAIRKVLRIKWLICAVYSVLQRAKSLCLRITFVCLSGYKKLLPPANQTRHVLLSFRYDHFFFALEIRNYVIFCAYVAQLHRFLLKDSSQNNPQIIACKFIRNVATTRIETQRKYNVHEEQKAKKGNRTNDHVKCERARGNLR
jgi:hypothetical protein